MTKPSHFTAAVLYDSMTNECAVDSFTSDCNHFMKGSVYSMRKGFRLKTSGNKLHGIFFPIGCCLFWASRSTKQVCTASAWHSNRMRNLLQAHCQGNVDCILAASRSCNYMACLVAWQCLHVAKQLAIIAGLSSLASWRLTG